MSRDTPYPAHTLPLGLTLTFGGDLWSALFKFFFEGAGRFCPTTITGLPQNACVSSGVALRTGIVIFLFVWEGREISLWDCSVTFVQLVLVGYQE